MNPCNKFSWKKKKEFVIKWALETTKKVFVESEWFLKEHIMKVLISSCCIFSAWLFQKKDFKWFRPAESIMMSKGRLSKKIYKKLVSYNRATDLHFTDPSADVLQFSSTVCGFLSGIYMLASVVHVAGEEKRSWQKV